MSVQEAWKTLLCDLNPMDFPEGGKGEGMTQPIVAPFGNYEDMWAGLE